MLPDFSPPFSDPLIDDAIVDLSVAAKLFGESSLSFTLFNSVVGRFNRTSFRLGVGVMCARGFNGSDCNTFCDTSNNITTCYEGMETYKSL